MNHDIDFLLISYEDDIKVAEANVSTENCFDLWSLKVIHPRLAFF
jgi:hypothetical protein